MYAIIATGGKQYKVAEGDVIRVEKLNAEDGASVTFDNVIVLNNDKDVLTGDAVKNASVKASVVKTAKSKKVTVYKFKPKTGYHKKNGHRQIFTEVKIEAINA
ncbi:MAG: 50S ribosomal protein L21 [Lachnospiraceae bacterium]|nr:50S ribosomal protein L21 [Lachnospiraceae bacterium]